MSRLSWDEIGEHYFETGVDQAVLYPYNSTSKEYKPGVAWNGITSISENPSGAEATPIYADNIKYLNLYSVEELGLTLEAYTYPDEFALCDGTDAVASGINGVVIGQQERKSFGLCYRTKLGSDSDGNNRGYKLHLVYGCMASPSEKAYQTINDSPEAITFSWDISTTPIKVTGKKNTSIVTIDSTKLSEAKLTAVENALYGTNGAGSQTGTDAYLPTPDQLISIINSTPDPEPTPGPEENVGE